MITAECSDGFLSSDTPTVDALTLKAGSFTLITLPVAIGELSESSALSTKRRLHHSEDGSELTLDLENQIPFGSEPKVVRKIRFSEGLACVTMDIVTRNSSELTQISAGGLLLKGPISKIGWLRIPQQGSAITAPEMQDFEKLEDGTVLYDESCPPLGLVIENDGERFDWMAGDDLWRWTNASRLGGKSRFTITKTEKAIRFQWELLDKAPAGPDEEPVPGRNWRLTWAVAWKKLPLAAQVKPYKKYDLTVCCWPTPTQAVSSVKHHEDEASERGCLCDSATQNILKKWVRSNLNSVKEGDVFALVKVLPVYCVNAGHLDRAKQKSLQHWDMMAIIEFRRWANRLLAKRGCSMKILAPENSPLRGFMILG